MSPSGELYPPSLPPVSRLRRAFGSGSGPGTGLVSVAATAVAVLALARLARLTLTGLAEDPGGERMQDFRDATYYPIRELMRPGGMPYDPQAMFAHWPVVQEFDLYLPAHLWLHAPLALPDYAAGAALMFALGTVLTVLLTWFACRWAAGPPWAWPALTALLLVGQVGKAQLYLGQVNPLVSVGVAGTLGFSHRPRLAATCLALAWIKPQFGLPLTLLLLARRRARTAVAGTLLAGVASLPVVAVLIARTGGPAGLLDVVRRNLDYAASTSYGAVDSPDGLRVDVVATAARLFAWSPPTFLEPLAAAVVLVTAAVLLRRAEPADQVVPAGLADLVTLLAVVLAVVHQPGDVLVTVPASVVLAVTLARRWRAGASDRRVDTLCVMALAALAVPHLHLYVVDQLLLDLVGRRVTGLVDAVAVLVATAAAGAALATALRIRDSTPSPAVRSG